MDKILFENKWVQLKERDGWYTFSHNTRGDGVSVLLFDSQTKEIVIRFENTPPHGGFNKTALTGTIEDGYTAKGTAVKEVLEEAGVTITEDELIYLGWVYPSKFSDFKQYLFAVDIAGKAFGAIEGDGTEGERDATVMSVSIDEALFINESSISACIARLAHMKGLKLL